MADTAFSHIKEAEAQAQALIKDAQEEAVRIVKQAETDTADAYAQFTASYRQQMLDMKSQAEAEARSSFEAFTKETEALCDDLRQRLSAGKPRAVAAVMRYIAE